MHSFSKHPRRSAKFHPAQPQTSNTAAKQRGPKIFRKSVDLRGGSLAVSARPRLKRRGQSSAGRQRLAAAAANNLLQCQRRGLEKEKSREGNEFIVSAD